VTKKINIKAVNSPARKHVRYLQVLEKQAFLAYRIAMRHMVEELRLLLQQEKLMKSDKLGTGWTGDVNKISLNMNEVIEKVIGKYMKALQWTLLGDYAGKDARAMAKKLGFVDKFVPGIMQAAYLNSLDMHQEQFQNVMGQIPADIPKYLLEASMDKIAERTNRYIGSVSLQLENSILLSLDRIFEDLHMGNIASVHKKATSLMTASDSLDPLTVIKDVSQDLRSEVPKSWFDREVKQAVNNFRPNWERTIRGEVGLSSAAATHQAIQEIYGGNDDQMRVVWLTDRSNRVCQFCNHISMHANGEFKYYTLKDLKPSGYNIGKKKAQWGMAIPPTHPNCRCVLVYVPSGFKVSPTGELSPI